MVTLAPHFIATAFFFAVRMIIFFIIHMKLKFCTNPSFVEIMPEGPICP